MLDAGGVRTVASGQHRRPARRQRVDGTTLDAFVVECTSFRLAMDGDVPRRGRGVAQPRPRPPQLARVDGDLRGGQGPALRPAAGHGRGDRRRRRSGVMAPPRRRAGPPRARSAGATPTTTRRRRASCAGPHGRVRRRSAALRRGAAPRRDERAGGRGARARDRAGRAPTPSPPGWRRSAGRRTASSWSATRDGVRWYNDSKATTPHAASAAIRAFDRSS